MEISKTTENDVVILNPDAAIIDEATHDLHTALQECVQGGELRIVVDLASVPFMDSRALEVLIDTHAELHRVGGEVKLARPTATCLDILKATRLDTRLQVHEDRASAARSFV